MIADRSKMTVAQMRRECMDKGLGIMHLGNYKRDELVKLLTRHDQGLPLFESEVKRKLDVGKVIAHYEGQTENEAVAEDEAGTKHTLVVIGYIGMKIAYLDIEREEAIRRYKETHTEETDDVTDRIYEIHFTDSFQVYEAWELEDV
jgi:hypothetical protein